ncbi:MAG: hypothetical protein FWE17_01370 [Alphaproteobacteria bacterium]|nr:hypothetical protein [Alphaproteobacteria bacterium]MCL2758463.1 hypothetical protein [Alphaproteobacteria bacterium]
MPDTIEHLLERLTTADSAPCAKPPSPRKAVIKLSPDQITSAVHVISPAQITQIAELFANNVANALNMRALAPRIRIVAEQSLRTALGSAKRQGMKP